MNTYKFLEILKQKIKQTKSNYAIKFKNYCLVLLGRQIINVFGKDRSKHLNSKGF